MAGKWRRRFTNQRLDGLYDEPRPGKPPTVSIEQVEDVIVTPLEPTPQAAAHWSRRKTAEKTGLSASTIGRIWRIWRIFEIKPHCEASWKLSNDPQFVEKVYDIIGLYLSPPESAVVYCVDEKSPFSSGSPKSRGFSVTRSDSCPLRATPPRRTTAAKPHISESKQNRVYKFTRDAVISEAIEPTSP